MKPTIDLNGHPLYFLPDLKSISQLLSWETYSSVVILCDENTRAFCLPGLKDALPELKDALILEIPSGETYKKLDTCEKVWQELFNRGIDRRALLINLGGGVITDMGGFIASTYKRGIDFVNIPTTLLAQVDATLGGKTGVDFGDIKNGIGLFAFPKAIFIHTPFLKTLDDAQLLSGFAEMLKHGLITSPKNWERISAVDPLAGPDWNHIIKHSLLIKKKIVEKDPYETGIRKALNFGHTIGHALEGYSMSLQGTPAPAPFDYAQGDKRTLKQQQKKGRTEPGEGHPERSRRGLLHGHAVALGMVAELWLSSKKAGFPKRDVQKISATLLKLYRSCNNIEFNIAKLIRLMVNDKKNKTGQINFVLLNQIGKPAIDVSCNEAEIRDALKYLEDQL